MKPLAEQIANLQKSPNAQKPKKTGSQKADKADLQEPAKTFGERLHDIEELHEKPGTLPTAQERQAALRARIAMQLVGVQQVFRENLSWHLAKIGTLGTIVQAHIGEEPHGAGACLKIQIDCAGGFTWQHVIGENRIETLLQAHSPTAGRARSTADAEWIVGREALVEMEGPSSCKLWCIFPKE